MATSTQKRLWMNRSNWNSKTAYCPHMKVAVEILSEPKMGVSWVSPNLRSLILELPGAFFCAIFAIKVAIAIFLFEAHNQGVR
jgi:hypothetical protein